MTGLLSRLVSSTARASSVEKLSLTKSLSSLSHFQRAYLARNTFFVNRCPSSVRGLATDDAAAAASKKTTTLKVTATKKKAVKPAANKAKKTVKKVPKKKKKVAAKKKAPKKVLTAEEKAQKNAVKARSALLAEIRTLREQALDAPSSRSPGVMAILISQEKPLNADGRLNLAAVADRYRALSESQKEVRIFNPTPSPYASRFC
jgi:hypothetical protein